MTLVEKPSNNRPLAVALSPNPKGLSLIHRSDCAAAIWQRKPMPSFQSWMDGLEPKCLPKARLILPVESVHETVQQVCDVCGTPDCLERRLLVDDVSALATMFGELLATSLLQLRLDVVNSNACRKFHSDSVTARLICTYRGAGTQYGISTDGDDPKVVRSVPTGSAMLIRGKLWPETPSSGLLHRSPPIEGTGETRLLLVLDPVENGENRKPHNTLQ